MQKQLFACSLQICKLCKFHRKASIFLIVSDLRNFIIETPTQGFSYEIFEIFKDNFFTEHLRWLLLEMGVPYLVKL